MDGCLTLATRSDKAALGTRYFAKNPDILIKARCFNKCAPCMIKLKWVGTQMVRNISIYYLWSRPRG